MIFWMAPDSGIHVLHVVRLVGPGGQDLGRRPDVRELDPFAAEGIRAAVDDVRRVGLAGAGRTPRKVGHRAEQMAVVHDHPFQSFFHQRRDDGFVERALRRPETLGILGGAPAILVLLLVQADLHDHGFLAGQRHQAVVVRDAHHVQARIAQGGFFVVARRLVVRGGVAEGVRVFRQGTGIAALRTGVGHAPVVRIAHGGGRPILIGVLAVAIEHAAHDAVGHASVAVRHDGVFVGVVDRLVHVPEVRDVDRHRRRRHRADEDSACRPDRRPFRIHVRPLPLWNCRFANFENLRPTSGPVKRSIF